MSKSITILLVICAFLFTGIALTLYVGKRNMQKQAVSNTQPTTQEQKAAIPNPQESTESAITAGPQPAGKLIRLNKVIVPKSGYLLVVKKDPTPNSRPIYGVSQLFQPGTFEQVTIDLYDMADVSYKNLKAGDTLIVSLYADNGDKTYGKADVTTPLTDGSGQPITAEIKLQ